MNNTIATGTKLGNSQNDSTYLKGLDSLRFLAAFFIIAMHIQNNQKTVGLPQLPDFAFLYKGAVSFFFTLSGFLITYIKVREYDRTGTINARRFFGKRFFRLAPLYYTIITMGLIFYWIIVPKLGMEAYNDYPIGVAIFSYTIFLPNLVNNLFHVGGALYVAWSIGAQEQFYWFLFPVMKKRMRYLPYFLVGILLLFVSINIANAFNLFGLSKGMQAFIHSLRFHYMAIGSLLGYYLYYNRERLLSLWIFSKPAMQILLFGLLIGWYGFNTDSTLIKNTITLPLSLLYGWIVINVGANPKNVIRIANPVFDWIGQRTFGVYMMHMFVVYAVSFFFSKTGVLQEQFWIYQLTFYSLVFGITIFLAHLSLKYYEKFFMNIYYQIVNRNRKNP